jgi:hypothetical protein
MVVIQDIVEPEGGWSYRLSVWTLNAGTWVLFHHDSSAAPQTVQTASPVCDTKNFVSVRLYSAPRFSTFVLGAAIASDNYRHSRNMRPE